MQLRCKILHSLLSRFRRGIKTVTICFILKTDISISISIIIVQRNRRIKMFYRFLSVKWRFAIPLWRIAISPEHVRNSYRIIKMDEIKTILNKTSCIVLGTIKLTSAKWSFSHDLPIFPISPFWTCKCSMLRPISPELVLFPDFWVSNIPRYFFFCLNTYTWRNINFHRVLRSFCRFYRNIKKDFNKPNAK